MVMVNVGFESVVKSAAQRWLADHFQQDRDFQVLVKDQNKPPEAAIILEPYQNQSTTVLHFTLSASPLAIMLDGTKFMSASSAKEATMLLVKRWLLQTHQEERPFEISTGTESMPPNTFRVVICGSNIRSVGHFTVYVRQILADWPHDFFLWVASFTPFEVSLTPQQYEPMGIVGDRVLDELKMRDILADMEQGTVWRPFPESVTGHYWLVLEDIKAHHWPKVFQPLLQKASKKDLGLLCYVSRTGWQPEIILGLHNVGAFLVYKPGDDWRNIGFLNTYWNTPVRLTSGPMWLRLAEYLEGISTAPAPQVPLFNRKGDVLQWSGNEFLATLHRHGRATFALD